MINATADIPANDTSPASNEGINLRWLARTIQHNFVRDVALFAAVFGHPPDTATAKG